MRGEISLSERDSPRTPFQRTLDRGIFYMVRYGFVYLRREDFRGTSLSERVPLVLPSENFG